MLVEVKVPQLSESVAEATLLTWHKKAGEYVKRDENLIDIETDKVVAMIGGFSILDCPVNADYYKQMGYYVIDSGIAPECYSTPNSAADKTAPKPRSNFHHRPAAGSHLPIARTASGPSRRSCRIRSR